MTVAVTRDEMKDVMRSRVLGVSDEPEFLVELAQSIAVTGATADDMYRIGAELRREAVPRE